MGVKKREQRHAKRVARSSRKQKNEEMLKAKMQLDKIKKSDYIKKYHHIIAKEIHMTRLLANPEKRVRDKALKNLRKWLIIRSQSSFEFKNSNFMNLWKGLFYYMWLSDEMLLHEEAAEKISTLVHCFNSMDTIVMYTACALNTLAIEWLGLDHYKVDKFYMLIRRVLRQTFVACRNQSWDMEWVMKISDIIEKLLLNSKISLGFNMHMTEIYLEELAKVGDGELPKDVLHEFIKPFILYLTSAKDVRIIKHVVRYIFRHLILQSDIGMDYTEKFEAWKNAGFPCSNIDEMKKIEISEESDENSNDNKELSTEKEDWQSKPLDPRAGRVNVELPQLFFDVTKIVEELTKHRYHPTSSSKSRREVYKLIEEFRKLDEGKMPVGIKEVRKQSDSQKDSNMKAAWRLVNFEENLSSEKKLSKKEKKEKYRKLIKYNEPLVEFSLKNNWKNENTSKVNVDMEDTSDVNMEDTSDLNMEDTSDLDVNETLDLDVDDTSDLNADDVSENDSIDMVATTKINIQNSNVNASSRKHKRPISMHKEFESKCEITNNKQEKSNIKMSTKKNKKTKLKRKNDNEQTPFSDKRVKYKAILQEQDADSKNQCNSVIASNTQHQKVLKKMNKSIKKPVPKINTSQDDQELSNQIKKQSEKSSIKKKVVFGLYRNTVQHTSEYIQQIRKSPAIPFDANRKPLASVLKMSPLTSPINPFYKKKFAIKNQRI